MPESLKQLLSWIDARPVPLVVLVAFALGSALGIAMKIARKGKYEEKEKADGSAAGG